MFVGAIMNNDKNTINILKTSIAVFSLLSIFNFIGIAGSSYALYNKTADSKNFFILKTTTKKYCKSESCDFDYTGDEQMFVAPKTGTYKLETWGAQGGGSYTSDKTLAAKGGTGGYAQGVANLNKSSKLYINIGGSGSTAYEGMISNSGGYNGGGASGIVNQIYEFSYGSGGGATHIATRTGLLSTLENNKDSILIVSGGGGGSGFRSDVSITIGGSGGGYIGNVGKRKTYTGGNEATGGTQTSYGSFGTANGNGCRNGKNASFGLGGSCPENGTGGGSGYYGGGAAYLMSGGGGSGYISNTSLIDKHMACYNCETSDEVSTKTISVTCASETPTVDCSKIGNGYARITYLGN